MQRLIAKLANGKWYVVSTEPDKEHMHILILTSL